MKKAILTLLLLLPLAAQAQSLSVFDIDTTDYPIMRAKFYVFDENRDQIINLSPSDFEITENGEQRDVISVSCPEPKEPVAISSVLTIDVSGSMTTGTKLNTAKEAGKAWINGLPLGKSECAITAFDTRNNMIQDFTTNRSRLLEKLNILSAGGGTDFDAGFINPMSGALLAAEKGKYKKVVVFVTDGFADGNEVAIIQKSNEIGATVFCVTIGFTCPLILRNIAEQTGGKWFENIATVDQARQTYLKILQMAQGGGPCEIEWESGIHCNYNKVIFEAKIPKFMLVYSGNYLSTISSIAKLQFSPVGILLLNKPVGVRADTVVTITAFNSDFIVSNITSNNPEFEINPKSFSIKAGESKELIVSFTPVDESNKFAKFDMKNDLCNINYYSAGRHIGQTEQQKTLKLTHPNGGEEFLVGRDTIITWEGILPTGTVSLDYSINNGKNWNNITDSASDYKYVWKNIPSPESDECLIKIDQDAYRESDSHLIWSTAPGGHINDIAYNPDGSKIAYNIWDIVYIVDSKTGNLLRILSGHSDDVKCLSFSPDGNKIATASYDNTCKLWDLQSGKEISTLIGHSRGVECIIFSPDGSKIASGSWDNTIKIWDSNNGAELCNLSGHKSTIESLSFSPDGKLLASGSRDSTCKIWDIASGSEIRTLTKSVDIFSVDFNPDGSILASAGRDGIKLWDVKSGVKISHDTSLIGHKDVILDLMFSPNGRMLASGSKDKTIKLWDVDSGDLIRTLIGHEWGVYCLSFSPDGSNIASGGLDKTIRIWDVSSGTVIDTLSGHENNVNSVKFSPDGNKIASCSDDRTIKIWDSKSGIELTTFIGYSMANDLSYSPDGSKLASAWDNRILTLWDIETGTEIDTLTGHSGNVISVSFSPDGSMIASGSADKTIKLWDASNGTEIRTLTGHSSNVMSVSFSPDGSMIASCSTDSTIKLWDASNGTEIRTLTGHSSYVMSISFSPDGSMIASGGADSTVRVWDVNSGMEIHTLKGQSFIIYCVTYSPDGSKIASAGNKMIKIWDANRGIEISTLKANSICWTARNLSFSPDGKILASGSVDNTVKTWIIEENILQSDTSDAVFSIVAPHAEARSIDMGREIVGEVKDSLFADFVVNTGSYKVRIDSIYFSGADANAFAQVSAFPVYEIDVDKAQSTEFRFIPNRVGLHTAKLNIITQAENLEYDISGIGEERRLQLACDILDFGEVEMGNDTIIADTVLIRNLTNQQIDITGVSQLGPDMEQFNIISGGGTFTLAPSGEHKMSLQFMPKYGGRTSGQLGFEYEGAGSPAIVQLFGTGKGGLVYAADDSAYAGDQFNIKLMLGNVKPEGIAKLATDYKATIRFQRTLLAPSGSIDWQSTVDSIYITIKGKIGNTVELSEIPVIACLGNTEETAIDVVEMNLLDESGNPIEYEFEKQSGTFTLLGICREGGARLINPNIEAGIINISPNPAEKSLNIEISLIEEGQTELSIFNSFGESVQNIFSANNETTGANKFKADISNLANGVYYVILKTPNQHFIEKVLVIR